MSTRTLQECARCNMTQELRVALESGADPNEKDTFGTTALQYAIAENNNEAVAILMEHGADITIQDKEGRTALHYSIEHGMPKMAALLLDKNPRIVAIGDRHGNEPLWVAAFNARGNYEIVSLLMCYGADPVHRNRANLSPLDFAKRINDAVLLSLLDPGGLHAKG